MGNERKQQVAKVFLSHLSDLHFTKKDKPRRKKERPVFDGTKAKDNDLVTFDEMAQDLRVKPQHLRNLKYLGKFIEPDVAKGNKVLFRWWKYKAWKRATGREGARDE